jgi:hypothetical protein
VRRFDIRDLEVSVRRAVLVLQVMASSLPPTSRLGVPRWTRAAMTPSHDQERG